MIIDEEENYKLNGENKTDHNSIIIEINKNTSTVKKKIYNYQWKINSNTNWTRFRETMQNKIIKNKPKNYKELEKIIIQTAIEETGLFNNKNNEVYSNKKVKEACKLKIKAKKEYEMAIRIKNLDQIKNKLGQYRKHQINLTNITNNYEIKTTKNKLKVINNGRTNSKRFWNLIRQIKKSNAEDLYAVKW